MPGYYDYRCSKCSTVYTEKRDFEDRLSAVDCECGGVCEYQFPVSAALGFQPFESYYDESLGCDIKGKRHHQEVMRSRGVIEAGDPVRGARNVESNATGRMAERGIRHSDIQRGEEIAKERADNKIVTVIEKDGTERTAKVGDVGSDTSKTFKTKTQLPKE